jgi:hypothetical protein
MNLLRGKRKENYNLLNNEILSFNASKKKSSKKNVCKKNDYKCKFEHCERARIQGRQLPLRPERISSGEYATVGSPPKKKEPFYEVPEPLYGNVRMTRVSSPKEDIYEEIGESSAGGTRRRKHAVKSTHKKRKGGKRTMRKGWKRTMHKGGKRTMRKGGKRTMHKGGKRTMRKGWKSTHKKIVGGFNRSSEDIISDFNNKSDDKKCLIMNDLDIPKTCNNSNITVDNENIYNTLGPRSETTVPPYQFETTGLPPVLKATVRTANNFNKQNLYEGTTSIRDIEENKKKTQRPNLNQTRF